MIDGIPVTSAASFGRLVTDMDLTIDRRTKLSRRRSRSTTRSSPGRDRRRRDPGPDRPLRALSAPLAQAGDRQRSPPTSPARPTRPASRRSATSSPTASWRRPPAGPGRRPGGVHEPGRHPGRPAVRASGAEGDGKVTYEEAFTVQPFGNSMVTMTLTGAQIETMLEQQFCGINAGRRGCCSRRSGSATLQRRPHRVRRLRHRRRGRPGDHRQRRRARSTRPAPTG